MELPNKNEVRSWTTARWKRYMLQQGATITRAKHGWKCRHPDLDGVFQLSGSPGDFRSNVNRWIDLRRLLQGSDKLKP